MPILYRERRFRLEGIAPASAASASAEVLAQVQVFALKQATQANAAAALGLIQALPRGAAPPHVGNQVDASA